MPGRKSWTGRIPLILQAVENFSAPALSRVDVESIFGIGRSQANAVLDVAGCRTENLGGVRLKVCQKQAMIDYLRNGRGADEVQEFERRRKLARALEQSAQDLKLHQIPIATRAGDEFALLRDLPNVTIKPGELRVLFTDPNDLFRQLMVLAHAIGNEYDAFGRLARKKEVA